MLAALNSGCATWDGMERSEKGVAVGATGGAVVGAILGGPFGAAIGAGVGGYAGHHQGCGHESVPDAPAAASNGDRRRRVPRNRPHAGGS
jgi:hypothetical protein